MLSPLLITAQPNPVSLRQDVKVDFVMKVKPKAARVAMDPISKNLVYITSTGEVREIKNTGGSPTDNLLYTKSTHDIAFLQGMVFIDSALFVIGNKMIDSTGNVGMIKKAVLQPDGSRSWVNVATTDVYQQSYTWYDHGFSGMVVSPDKQYLYFSSGSRTDHGEIQSNNGLYPGMREVPLTSAIFRIPANSVNLTLPNTDSGLAPYLYADGLRNAFDMAFDSDGNLFATENSGDRDDPDELNWIRQGKHYGFPWIMGGNDNPQQFPGYDPDSDPLLNTQSHCYLKGYYANDPTFPPKGTQAFVSSIRNLGPDGDKYRESNGKVNDGSTSGNFVHSFTPHRCPAGIAFDREKILSGNLNGDAFVISFTRKGDSTGLDVYGYPGTIVDPGQDLMHLELSPDGSGNYKMNATTLVKGFDYPVDTYLHDNILYVIEHNMNGDGRLFKITLPSDVVSTREPGPPELIRIHPNPNSGMFTVCLGKPLPGAVLCVFDLLGKCVFRKESISERPGESCRLNIDLSGHPKGVYLVRLETDDASVVRKVVIE
jgi:hypothetical protein